MFGFKLDKVFYPLEVVNRVSEAQLQVGGNHYYLMGVWLPRLFP